MIDAALGCVIQSSGRVIVAMTATKGLLGEYRMLPLADLGELSDAWPAVGP